MFCTKCGTQLTDDSRFCYKCGAPMNHDEEPKDTVLQGELDNAVAEKPEPEQDATQPVAQPATAQPQQQKALSSAADDGIISILGFVFSFSAPLIGLVLSLIGYRKPKYRSLAIAGIIIGTILLVGLLVIVAIGFKNMPDSSIPLFILIATLL